MLEKIRKLLDSKSVEMSYFKPRAHAYGVEFVSENMDALRVGQGSSLEQHQLVTLRMLAEQGAVVERPDGFDMPSEDVVLLGDAERLLLGLPQPWHGEFNVNFNGVTTHPSFTMNLELILPSGERVRHFKLNGPFLGLSEKEIFLPDKAQWDLLEAVKGHGELKAEGRTERANLEAVYDLQRAKSNGAVVDLSQFDHLRVERPKRVGVSISQLDDGSLGLFPQVGEGATPEDIQSRTHQLDDGGEVLRVRESLVVLDDACLDAVHEILSNSRIPVHQVRQFLETPGAFLDATKVDLDMGFSIRVKGATEYESAYFGEKDASPTDWTGAAGLSNPPALPLADAGHCLHSSEDVSALQQKVQAARANGQSEVEYGGRMYLLDSDSTSDDTLIETIRKAVADKAKKSDVTVGGAGATGEEGLDKVTATVDIDLQDERNVLETNMDPDRTYAYDKPLVLPCCTRTPFSYQEVGIRWILGLATNNGGMDWGTPSVGGVLADDMGLGKTFMSLVAAVEYAYIMKKSGEVAKPCLVVAPLTLLQNWREEVEKAFEPSPFKDIVMLQGQVDLPKFTARFGRETKQREEDIHSGLSAIRYALKVGPSWGMDRLDMPERLVLATYQTLRDYQFSLCLVDWGFVIFDEAQNIKNPDTLQSRAARGIKADFVLPATGTPVENSLADLWCLFDTAVPGLLKNYQAFRKEYISPIKAAVGPGEQEVRAEVGRKLRKAVGNLMLRRIKEDELDGLPRKFVHNGADEPSLRIEMRGEQRKWYESILASASVAVSTGDASGNSGMLKALHSLRDVCLHPALLNGGLPAVSSIAEDVRRQFEVSGKLTLLLTILDQIRARGEKVIVFVIRKRLQTYLAMSLGIICDLNIDIINGDTKAFSKRDASETRMGIIKRFEEREGFNVIIMSPVAAGVGLTVVGANNVVHLERHWNPAKEAQATDRVYRIGATKDVHVYIPILAHPEIDSFDVHLNRLLNRKLDLKDAVVTPVEVSSMDLVGAGVLGGVGFKGDAVVLADGMADMSWQNFEALTALAFEYELRGESMLTKQPTDWGADVVIKSSLGNVLVQCKHLFNDGEMKGDGAVREVYGAKPQYEALLGGDIKRLIVATNAKRISSETRQMAKKCDVELWGFKDLASILEKAQITYAKVISKERSERFPQ
ncbi:MAG: restriction endonuclease [Proteobacteria bacterium]|nr:restriction endonuclease [Pseudomonadota bacterium]